MTIEKGHQYLSRSNVESNARLKFDPCTWWIGWTSLSVHSYSVLQPQRSSNAALFSHSLCDTLLQWKFRCLHGNGRPQLQILPITIDQTATCPSQSCWHQERFNSLPRSTQKPDHYISSHLESSSLEPLWNNLEVVKQVCCKWMEQLKQSHPFWSYFWPNLPPSLQQASV